MPRNELTQAQENFCKAYIKYGIAYKAYLEAYPKANTWKRNSVDVEATKMLNSPKISHRLTELNNEIESTLKTSTTLNKRKLLETALQMLEDTNNPAERTHAVSLIKLLFAKEGMTQPQQQINVNIQNNTVVGEVSDYLNL